MSRRAWLVAPLLFGSGACALVYQIAWFREFRLVFGASTAASAAVLAIFIGGLGLGGVILGRRADRHAAPLRLYAHLELAVALTAALTPALLWIVRQLYVAAGGTVVLGMTGGTIARIVLAALVLAIPTVCMGGTLPAAARAVETEDDARRGAVALLYGLNTLGAVTGCLVGNFLLLETFGTRATIWFACGVNLLVVVIARGVSRRIGEPAGGAHATATAEPQPPGGPAAPMPFVLAAAAIVGFAFFLMELVWYRMLGPLLGGTIFTFGLILAVALLGIGLGGFVYSLFGKGRPATLAGFAYTCLLEAACLAIPFALGDRIAVWALLLRDLGNAGFGGHILGWTLVTSLVVLPAAFVAGYQFPMLIALLGRGAAQVGRQIGLAYAWNTVGAILGALAGGFGLLPALTAPGSWRAAAALLVALGVSAIALSLRHAAGAPSLRRRSLAAAAPAGIALVVAALLVAAGPTAAWRHSPIGTGRVRAEHTRTVNALRNWIHAQRRSVIWEAEGIESSVALDRSAGLSFVLNGKNDGNARIDAPTQVMSGILGAILHPAPKRAMVIGLGSGSTAGWLGAVPSIERVDVVELEPAILEVARRCAPVNQDVMRNPKVHTMVGDAREVLLATPRRYDIVFSEPSNPYRAGIASLFTRDYYRAVAGRLDEGGLFLQWVQGYDIAPATVKTIYATLAAEFPFVETWQIHEYDLMLVASRQPIRYDLPALRAKIREEPFATALRNVWRTDDLEGVLARFVARGELAVAIAKEVDELNTDDRNGIEFGFARSVGRPDSFDIAELRAVAGARGDDTLELHGGALDWARVVDQRTHIYTLAVSEPPLPGEGDARRRALAFVAWQKGDLAGALAAWRGQGSPPRGPTEIPMLAEALAEAGDPGALVLLDELRGWQPAESDAIYARLLTRAGRLDEAVASLERAWSRYREDPWPSPLIMRRTFALAEELGARDPALASRLFRALEQPMVLRLGDEARMSTLVVLATRTARLEEACVAAFDQLEPSVPWNRELLLVRRECYRLTSHPRLARAEGELMEFLEADTPPFGEGLLPE